MGLRVKGVGLGFGDGVSAGWAHSLSVCTCMKPYCKVPFVKVFHNAYFRWWFKALGFGCFEGFSKDLGIWCVRVSGLRA